MPKRGDTAVVQIMRAGPDSVERRSHVAIAISECLLRIGFTRMCNPTVAIFLSAFLCKSRQSHGIGAEFVQRNSHIWVGPIVAVCSMTLRTVPDEQRFSATGDYVINGPV